MAPERQHRTWPGFTTALVHAAHFQDRHNTEVWLDEETASWFVLGRGRWPDGRTV